MTINVDFPGEVPDKPEGLTPAQRREWDLIVQDLNDAGTLKHCDRAVLIQYIAAWRACESAQETLEREGYTFTTPTATKAHPAGDIAVRFSRICIDCLNALGLTPAGRRRLRLADRKPVNAKLERFLAGSGTKHIASTPKPRRRARKVAEAVTDDE
ncbi:MAG: phage terminase small subunit P27 family [bacterium]|nr:phage terminase small subunit P27 family [bacterium]